MTTIAEAVKRLGKTLPDVKQDSQFRFSPAVRTGNLLFISGQISETHDGTIVTGLHGAGMTVEEGQRAAELCALRILALIAANTDGKLSSVRRIVRLGVFVHSTPDFHQQSQVANGATNLILEVFGDAGKHARAAIGVASLPVGCAVEADAIVELA